MGWLPPGVRQAYSLILNVAWEHLRIYCLLAQLRVCDDVILSWHNIITELNCVVE